MDPEGSCELSGTDLANLGFAPQREWKQVLENVKAAKFQTREEALEFARNHPALRIREADIRFHTIYAPVNWNLLDAKAAPAQPGFEEQLRWWKAQCEAGLMVMYGIGIDHPPGMVLVGWTCATQEEADALASAAPWVRLNVLSIQQTAGRK